MSEVSPDGALDALLSRTVNFAGRETALTCGALLAVESLKGEEIESENLTVWTLLCVSQADSRRALEALRSSVGIVPFVLDWAAGLSDGERELALCVARRLIRAYRESRCVYVYGKGEHSRGVECGNAIMNAGFFLREYGISFEDYFALPATRANALYAAWCEANGLSGKDTFYSREVLRGADAAYERVKWLGE